MIYRREIDGLRALAVLPVILFHAGFSTFRGGYVGVDVFFVISGYLITSLIREELEAGRFSIVSFYERRARRILPSLFFVMISCLVLAWLWLMPREMKEFSQSLIAVSTFVSNIFFLRTSGYFDTATELKPLLHTWSLAVEEQYYLLFPVFLILTWRFGKRTVFGLLSIVFIISLSTAQWASNDYPDTNFFILPTRGWELLSGAFASLYVIRDPKDGRHELISELASMAGIALITFATVFFDRNTPFPSLYTLVPTSGAVLIIMFSTRGTLTGRLLSSKYLVGIGLISYSAYLWHQPLFAFARIRSDASPSSYLMCTLIALSLVLASFSWKYIEAPFRKRGSISRKTVFLASSGTSFLIISIGIIGTASDGFPARIKYPPNVHWISLSEKLEKRGDVCSMKPNEAYKGLFTCEFGDTNSKKTIVLYGDSHAQAISRVLDNRMTELGYKVIRASIGCRVIFEITPHPGKNPKNIYDDCNTKFSELKRLINDNHASTLLVTRWTYQYFPLPGWVDTLPFDNGVGGIEKDMGYIENVAITSSGAISYGENEKRKATEKLIDGLSEASRTLFLTYPIPETGWDIFKVNAEYYEAHRSVLQTLTTPYARYLQRNKFVLKILENESEKNTNIVLLRPDLAFCVNIDKGSCVAQKDGVPYYYDDDHLSDEGATLVVEDLVSNFRGKQHASARP